MSARSSEHSHPHLGWRVAELEDQAPSLFSVYFVRYGDDGPIKIGSTRDIKSRIKTLQTGTPTQLTVIATFNGDPMDELRIQRHFRLLRIRGEWFRPEAELLEFLEGCRTAGQLLAVPAEKPLHARAPSR